MIHLVNILCCSFFFLLTISSIIHLIMTSVGEICKSSPIGFDWHNNISSNLEVNSQKRKELLRSQPSSRADESS